MNNFENFKANEFFKILQYYFYKLKKLTNIFNFYIDSNIHVAIAGASFVLITEQHFLANSLSYSTVFIFFGSILGYQFIRIFDDCNCNRKALTFNLKNQTLTTYFISFISLIGVLYFGLKIGFAHLIILTPPTLITIWYAIPFFKKNGERISLRNYPSIKIFSISLVWSVNTVIFPLQDQLDNPQVWIEFLQRVFLIIVLIIPFDIRDMQIDTIYLKTLPQKYGISKSKKIGVFYLVLFFLLSYFKQPITASLIVSELVIFMLALCLLIKSSTKQAKYYASFWVESVPFLWWIVLTFTSYCL